MPPAVIGLTIAVIYEIKLMNTDFIEYLMDFAPQRDDYLMIHNK